VLFNDAFSCLEQIASVTDVRMGMEHRLTDSDGGKLKSCDDNPVPLLIVSPQNPLGQNVGLRGEAGE